MLHAKHNGFILIIYCSVNPLKSSLILHFLVFIVKERDTEQITIY